MSWHKQWVACCLWAALFSSVGGCLASRRIVAMEPDTKGVVMLLKTYDLYSYGVFEQGEKVYWRCIESAGALRCERECDGETDLRCAEPEIGRP